MAEFRIITKPNPAALYQDIRRDIEAATKPVIKQHEQQYNDVVKDFENKPEFEGKLAFGPKQIEVQIILKNGSQQLKGGKATIKDLVGWLFKTGTKAHTIKPKKEGGVLAFPWGGPGSYSRITPVRGGTKGTGKVSNAQKTVAKKVKHPGFKPSDALERINKRLDRAFLKAIEAGIRKGTK